MRPLPIAASTMTTACGVGTGAVCAALQEGRSGLRRNDFEPAAALATWIGRVDAVESEALAGAFAAYDCRNNRLARIALEQDGFIAAVGAAARRHGAERIGVFLGTTTSGILSTELAFRAAAWNQVGRSDLLTPELYRCRHSLFAITEFVRDYLGLHGPAATISTACSSSAKVFAVASRSIAAGDCAAAIVGGVDSLAMSTLFGFHSLELLSRNPCRPCAADRDGISIGEAAGFALLDPGVDAMVRVAGVGESCDAYHMSSPHPNGAGAAIAMRTAVNDAGADASGIDYVHLHGTASRPNDAAEDRAILSVFGDAVPVSSTKGWTGHTLGAAGILGALIAELALRGQWMPGTLGCDTVDPELDCAIAMQSRPRALRRVLCNAFGFGGTNCSLVLESAR
ncbi:MAG: beta-ketoacyl-ACP synthase [Betaproteobacteria bacterium]